MVGALSGRVGRIGRRATAGARGTEAATAAVAAAPPQAAPAAGPARSRPGRVVTVPRWLATAVVAAALVATVAAVLFGVSWAGLNGQQADQAAVERVARSTVMNLTNLSPKTLDQYIAQLEAGATGQFLQQLKQEFNSGLRAQLLQAQAQAQGQIRNLYVQSLHGDRATVFAVADMTYVNRKDTAPVSDRVLFELDLVKTGAGWQVDAVTNPIASPGSFGIPQQPSTTSTTAGR